MLTHTLARFLARQNERVRTSLLLYVMEQVVGFREHLLRDYTARATVCAPFPLASLPRHATVCASDTLASLSRHLLHGRSHSSAWTCICPSVLAGHT